MPNSRPGLPVDPPTTDGATRARVHFIPEIERRFRRQVQILDRCLLNFGLTSNDKPSNPPDTWASLRPARTSLYPNVAPISDLSATDATLLAKFHGAVDEVDELLDNWISSGTQPEYNCWNYLMHKVEHSLRMGSNVIRKFCADRQFDATMPASGTLLSRAETGLGRANQMRTAFIDRKQAEHALAAARRMRPALSSRVPRARRSINSSAARRHRSGEPMKVEGGARQTLRAFRTDINDEPFECEGEYDTVAGVRAHRYRADRRYKISVRRRSMTRSEFGTWARANGPDDPSAKQ